MLWDEHEETRQRVVVETYYVKIKVFNWNKFGWLVLCALMIMLFFSAKHSGNSGYYQEDYTDQTEVYPEVYQPFEEIQ